MGFRITFLGEDKTGLDCLGQAVKPEFDPSSCTLASQALEAVANAKTDLLVLLDDPKDMSALTCLSVLRQSMEGRGVPVMMVSSHKGEELLLKAFELGVEDYLAGPCDPRELAARARAVLRRRREVVEHRGGPLELGGVEIDPSQRRCLVYGRSPSARGGPALSASGPRRTAPPSRPGARRVRLQPREFELLEVLMRRAGRVLTRAYLLESVWGMASDADTRAVDVAVSRLRRRLGKRAGRLIETVSKIGYCFTKND
ncbi:MAG: response regulator transcription factor [Elusimicrobiota bacterium]